MKREDEAPLDNEERELAARLRRLPPHGGPSADLDARILAMARAAQADPPRDSRARSHWPTYASAAAICVLAAGLAWQLWPAHTQRDGQAGLPATPGPAPRLPEASAPMTAPPEDITAAAAADAAATAAATPAGEATRPPAAPSMPEPPAVLRPAPPTPQPAILQEADTAPAASALGTLSTSDTPPAAAAARSAATPAAAPAKAMAAPAPVVAPAPAPPAPPAPALPPAPATAVESAAPASTPLMAKDAAKVRDARPADGTVNAATRAKTAADADVENGFDARPPATVQDAGVRNDWLKRIRELVAKGDRDAARASLQEYRTRYPDIPLPADLQPLLATPPAKSP